MKAKIGILSFLLLGFPLGILQAKPNKSLEKYFFKDPVIVNLTLSPDGEHIAGIGYFDGERVLQTMRVSDRRIERLRTTEGTHIGGYFWEENDVILYWLGFGNRPHWNLHDSAFAYYKTNAQLKFPKPILTEKRSAIDNRGRPEPIYILDPLPHMPSKMVIVKSLEQERSIYLQDIDSKERTLIDRTSYGEGSYFWLLGENHKPVIQGFNESKDGENMHFQYRKPESEEWVEFPEDEFGYPRVLHPNNRFVITRKEVGGPDEAWVFDIESGEAVGKPFRDENFSIQPWAIKDNMSSTVLGFSYETDRTHTSWFDPTYKKIYELLSKKYPEMDLTIIGYYPKGQLMVFELESDIQPPIYKAFLLKTGLVSDLPFLDAYPDINAEENSPTESMFFEARDGAKIHAFLTLPKGKEGPHPLIVYLHGGPHVRDTWGYDSVVQYFAKLGFAVFQVNYRGSSGFGWDYQGGDSFVLGMKQCAKDTIDGIKALREKQLIEEDKIGVYGWSFGGFGALSCAATEPDLFKFAIGCAGVYDLVALRNEDKRDAKGDDWASQIHDDEHYDPELYRELSPITHAESIKAKVFLYQGGLDHRVATNQLSAMESALKDAGNPPETMTEAWGIHGIMYSKDRIAFYKRLREFIESTISLDPSEN